MQFVTLITLTFSVAVITGSSGEDDSGCPLWTYRRNATSDCQCGTTAGGIVECNNTTGELKLHSCAGLTRDPSTNKSIVGHCPYSCVEYFYQPLYPLQMNSTSSSTELCKIFKRDGPLCSKCESNLGIPMYTYALECVECPHFQFKLLITYLMKSVIPPTLLFIALTIFHFHILRPPWSVYVLAAQAISTPLSLQSGLNISFNLTQQIFLKVMATLYGPWNLDFFRALYTPQCISPHITMLQSFVIEGPLGLYPLLLIAMLYTLVKCRDRGCRIALKIQYIYSRVHGTFNMNTSLIDAFSTFYLLSFVRIGFAAFYILAPTRVWSPNGTYIWKVYYDPSYAYFRFPHIVYAIPTLLIAVLLVIFPIILLFFYQYQWFQKLLHHLRLRSLALNTFVDAFQGCYNDGTNGTPDCRYFSALQLVLRLTLPLTVFFTKDPLLSVFLCSIALGFYITAFVLMKPYKEDIYNKTDIPVLMLLLLFSVDLNSSVLFKVYKYHHITWLSPCVLSLCVFVPLIYLLIWSLVHVKVLIKQNPSVMSWCARPRSSESEQLLSA